MLSPFRSSLVALRPTQRLLHISAILLSNNPPTTRFEQSHPNNNISNNNNSGNNSRNNYHRRNKKNNNKKWGKYNLNIQSTSDVPRDSPFYDDFTEFSQLLNTILLNRNLRLPNFSKNPSRKDNDIPLFWDSITKIIKLYDNLVDCPDLNSIYVSQYLNMLHNALRINRTQLIKLKKKPDYDSKSFNNQINSLILNSLRTAADDITNGKIKVNDFGMMHLYTAFLELLLPNEALQIWENSMKLDSLQKINLKPKVIGIMLPILYQFDYSWETIEKIYLESKKIVTRINSGHSLTLGMINTCLMANKNKLALELFNDMCSNVVQLKDRLNFDYVKEAHLAIIGKCRDIRVAELFWSNAIEDNMPYRLDLQVSYINSMLENIWQETKDFDKITNIWIKTLTHYNSLSLNIGIFSSLNNQFFKIFFEYKFLDDPETGLDLLKKILTKYHTIKGMDEPILNIVLAKCTIWKNYDVVKYVNSLFQLYNIDETVITKRIQLKNMNQFDQLTPDDIWTQWCQLITKLDNTEQTYIANADWASLRDATLPHKDRVTIYLQIVKLFQKYCRDYAQQSYITTVWSKTHPLLAERLNELDSISTDSLTVPALTHLKSFDDPNI